jgi:hypothetical protein
MLIGLQDERGYTKNALSVDIQIPKIAQKALEKAREHWPFEKEKGFKETPIVEMDASENGGLVFKETRDVRPKEMSENDRPKYKLTSRIAISPPWPGYVEKSVIWTPGGAKIFQMNMCAERFYVSYMKEEKERAIINREHANISFRFLEGNLETHWSNGRHMMPERETRIASHIEGMQTISKNEVKNYGGLKSATLDLETQVDPENKGRAIIRGYRPVLEALRPHQNFSRTSEEDIGKISQEESIDFLFGEVMPALQTWAKQ